MEERTVNNRIQKMIEEMCPGGVEYRRLGDITVSLKKQTLSKKQLIEDGVYPVVNSGKGYYGRYNAYNNEGNVVTVASRGNAGYITYQASRFWAGGLCYPYRSADESKWLTKYIYYALKNSEEDIVQSLVSVGSIPALNKADIDNFEIPVPPLQVQEEIVRILDAFTKLTAELTTELAAELAMRTKQYAYYRDELLTGKLMTDGVQYMSIGELIQFSSLRQKHISSQAPVYSVSNRLGLLPLSEYRMEGTSAHASKDTSEYYVVRKDWFAYRPAGLDVGTLGKMKGEIGLVSPAYKVFTVRDESVILPDYLALLFKTSLVKAGINRYVEVGARVRMDVDRWNRIYVPVPDIETQKRAVAFLHDLESVCTDLTSGLPAEIEARNKQYAYYRDTILQFDSK